MSQQIEPCVFLRGSFGSRIFILKGCICMKKRLLTITSIFLVACMLFTAFPVAAATVDGNLGESNASVDAT